MTWTNPSDAYGFGKVWWKLGSPPTSSTDGTYGDLPDSMPLAVGNPSQQATTLFVWLEDGANNVDYHNYASVTLPGNANLPTVAITSPTSTSTYTTSNPLLFLSGTVNDSSGTVDAMAWNDSLGGSGVFFNSGGTWSAPPIELLPGLNTIYVGAIDDKSNIGATSIIVTYTPSLLVNSNVVDVGSGPCDMAVGDFNGDGRPDMAVFNGYGDTVSVLLNNGDGGFTKTDYAVDGPGTDESQFFVADVNGDGRLDLVFASEGSLGNAGVSIMLNEGGGVFATPIEFGTGLWNVDSVAVADINGDGKLDLVVSGTTDYWDNVVSVLLNNGSGGFSSRTDYDLTSDAPESLVAADLNGDGKPDLAVVCRGVIDSSCLNVFLNKGNGTFTAATAYALGTQPYSMTAADFDGNGTMDLAVANEWDNTVSVLLNTGNGTFALRLAIQRARARVG